jgi:hypothetical protein
VEAGVPFAREAQEAAIAANKRIACVTTSAVHFV